MTRPASFGQLAGRAAFSGLSQAIAVSGPHHRMCSISSSITAAAAGKTVTIRQYLNVRALLSSALRTASHRPLP